MNIFARNPFRVGDLLSVHLKSGVSVRGSFVGASRRHVTLERHALDVDGVYVESRHDRLVIPRENVDCVEVTSR